MANTPKGENKVNGHRTPKILAQLFHQETSSAALDASRVVVDPKSIAASVTSIRTEVPPDAHTAPYLGLEREGNAVLINSDGLILTIGYLLLESRAVRVMAQDGSWINADYVGYDFDSGFGLARAQKPLNLTPIKLGDSTKLKEGSEVIIAAHGGRDHCIGATIIGRHEFAGYWEYLLDNAIFTAPAHPNWSGAALIGVDGLLYGIGSLLIDDAANTAAGTRGNMFVPVELLSPILDDLLSAGRVQRPPRPWLGMFTAETQKGLVVVHVTPEGPADRSGLALEDVILRVAEEPINDLAHMYRKMWDLGDAGTVVPLTVMRDTVGIEVTVKSASRYDYFRTPRE